MEVLKFDPKLNSKDLKDVVVKAAEILKRGGVLVYPTDTCYGLGAKVNSDKAISYLKRFKGREETKPFSVIVPSLEWIFKRIDNLNKERKEFILEHLPGPYTFIVKIKPKYCKEIKFVLKDQKLGFRYPDNKFCQLLAEKLGFPFTTTSANISGGSPAYSLSEFKNYLKHRPKSLWPDLFIDVRELNKTKPSKIIDLSVYPFKVLRD